jgi:hypothetical protein
VNTVGMSSNDMVIVGSVCRRDTFVLGSRLKSDMLVYLSCILSVCIHAKVTSICGYSIWISRCNAEL